MRRTLADLAFAVLPRVTVGRVLAHREWLTLVRTAEVLLEGAPVGVTSEQVADNVEAFLSAGRSRRAWRVRVLLTLIDLSSLPTHRRPFHLLTKSERRALIRARWIGGHRLGRICSRVRSLVLLGAYGDRRTGAKVGYVPVPLRPRFQHLRAVALNGEVA